MPARCRHPPGRKGPSTELEPWPTAERSRDALLRGSRQSQHEHAALTGLAVLQLQRTAVERSQLSADVQPEPQPVRAAGRRSLCGEAQEWLEHRALSIARYAHPSIVHRDYDRIAGAYRDRHRSRWTTVCQRVVERVGDDPRSLRAVGGHERRDRWWSNTDRGSLQFGARLDALGGRADRIHDIEHARR